MHREWNDDDAHLRSTARNLLSKSRFRLLLPSLVHRPASAKCRSTRRTRRTVQNQVASFRRDKKLIFPAMAAGCLSQSGYLSLRSTAHLARFFAAKKPASTVREVRKWITFQCSETN